MISKRELEKIKQARLLCLEKYYSSSSRENPTMIISPACTPKYLIEHDIPELIKTIEELTEQIAEL